MALLELNSKKITFSSNEFLNIKSLLPKIQKNFPFDEYHLSSFSINGNSVDISSDDPSLIRPIRDNDIITVQLSNDIKDQLDLLDGIVQLNERITKAIIDSSSILNEGNLLNLDSLISITEGVDTFIRSISYCLKNFNNNRNDLSALPVKELQIHLLSVVKAIISAHNKDDIIMLADLLEFELKDNLTQWKILIIPNLKNAIKAI